VQFGRPPGNRQSQSAAAGFGREKGLEDLAADIIRNSWTRIADLNDRHPLLPVRCHGDMPVPGHGLGGIQQQVQNRGSYQLAVGGNGHGKVRACASWAVIAAADPLYSWLLLPARVLPTVLAEEFPP